MPVLISVILPLAIDWEPWYYGPDGVRPGDRIDVVFAGRDYCAVVSSIRKKGDLPEGMAPEKIHDSGPLSGLDPVSGEEMEFWRFLSDYYLCTIGEVYKVAYPPGAIAMEKSLAGRAEKARLREELRKTKELGKIAALKDRLAEKEKILSSAGKETKKYMAAMQAAEQIRETLGTLERNSPEEDRQLTQEVSFTGNLTPLQSDALESILKAFDQKKVSLLRGVSGSGKTEIYMALAARTLNSGRSVLCLVPEIALSRQLEDRLREVFGNRLMVFHSAETPARRRDVANALRKGGPYLVLGTRSALFLPHKALGLIVVDEEHDTSYKQDSPAPRYNGRDSAIFLGSIFRANVLLGSATPSLESLYNCITGRYVEVELNNRYFGGQEAEVEIIDTIAESRKNGMVGSFSRKLIAAMEKTISAGDQIVLLRGRRAYAPIVQCQECGTIVRCPRCNIPLSYHRDSGRLVCHYCGHSELFSVCPSCSGTLAPVGSGTQRIEEEAAALFPGARIARLDSDSARAQGYEQSVIRDFSQGKIDILVGTQIVSKGFDFDRLMLVGILNADSLLGQQDFRADEKALQLFIQMLGRAGRRDRPGRLIVQTSRPSHPVYDHISGKGEYLENMLSERKAFGYPPFSRIVCLVLKDSDPVRLERSGNVLAEKLSQMLGASRSFIPQPGTVSVIGPYAPGVDQVAGTWIRHIRIILPKDRRLSSLKRDILEAVRRFTSGKGRLATDVVIDVDPA